MKAKLVLGAIFIALIASLAFGGKQLTINLIAPLFDSRAEIPDHVLYETIFRMRKMNREKSDKERKEGKAHDKKDDLLKKKFQLSDDEDAQLSQAADEFAEAIAPVDKRVNGLKDEYRKQFPKGQLKEGEQPPPPPLEITELQELRNAIVLNHRDKLQLALGSDSFGNVDKKVKGEFADGFRDLTTDFTTRRLK